MDGKTKCFSLFVVIVLFSAVFSAAATYSFPLQEKDHGLESLDENEVSDQDTFPLKGHANTAWMDERDGRTAFVKGTHYEMGYQHGALTGSETRETIDAFLNSIDEDVEELLEVYEDGEPYLQDAYKEEMLGLSHSSGQSLDRIKAIHAAPTLHHCSGFGVHGDATEDGSVYHTRSLDYDVLMMDPETGKTMQENSLTVFRDPDEGHSSAVPAWSGFVGSVDGINEEKISIGEMGQSTNDTTQEGLFMIFRLRNALEHAGEMDEAVELMKPNRTMGFGFVVADGNSNEAQVIEMSQNHYYNGSWDHPQEDNSHQHYQIQDAVRRGNHYAAYQTALTQRDDYMVMPSESAFMHYLNYLEHSKRIEREHGDIDFDTAQDIFTETYRGFPLQFTLHQAIFSPTEQSLRVSTAYPDGTGAFWNEFHEYSIPDIEGRPEMLNISNPQHNDTVSDTVEIEPDYLQEPESVEYYINGTKVGESSSAPFTYDWDSTTVPNGEHVVEIRADGEDHSAMAYVTVEVNNEGVAEGDAEFDPDYEQVEEGQGSQDVMELDQDDFGMISAMKHMTVPEYRYEEPAGSEDWIINETYHLNDTTETVDGNISIQEGGRLVVQNSTLLINSTFDHEYGLYVTDGGSLEIFDSIITNGTGRIYLRAEQSASHVEIIDSHLSGGGDVMQYPLVRIECSNITVEGSTLVHNSWGLYMEGVSDDPIDNVTVSDTDFVLENVAYIPMEGLVYRPKGASLWLGHAEEGAVENVTVEGINHGKLLSSGVILFSSENVVVSDIHVENEFIGVGGFGGSQGNHLHNLTVMDSHIGVAMLLMSQDNLIEDVQVIGCAAALGDIYNSEPGNLYRNIDVDDSTVTFLAEDTEYALIENLSSTNTGGGFLISDSDGMTIRDSHIEGEYVGVVLDDSNDATVENVSFDITRDLFGIALDESEGVVLQDIDVQGPRWALDVQGYTEAHFSVSVENFYVNTGELRYYEGEVPEEVSAEQVLIANVQDEVIDAQTGDSPLYLLNSENVQLDVSQENVVGGVIVDSSTGVDVTGEIINTSSVGLKVISSEDVSADIEVDGASWAYKLINSHGVSLEGDAFNLSEAVLHTKDSEDIVLEVESEPSTYGLISGYSSLTLIGQFPEAEYRHIIQGTSILTYNVSVEAPSDTIESEPGTYTYDFEVENIGNFADTYEIEVTSSAEDWSVTAPGSISVEEGAVETVEVTLTIPEEAEFGDGSEITLEAISQNDSTKADSDSMTVTYDELYRLTVQNPDHGTIYVEDDEVIDEEETFEYQEGEEVEIEAEAEENYKFVEWTGDTDEIEEVTADQTKIEMLGHYTISAEFSLVSYELTIDSGEGGDVVEPGEGTFEYDHGTEVDLEAEPEEGYLFVEWTGDVDTVDDLESSETTIEMLDDYSITAEFEQIEVEYELVLNAEEGGTTDPEPDTHIYPAGEEVPVEAIPDEGWEFSHWEDDYPEGDQEEAEIEVIMDSDKTLTAHFEEEEPVITYELTIDSTDGGEVIEPGEGTFEYDDETVVDLEAEPEEGYEFVEWTGDTENIEDPESSETTITMMDDHTITAEFEEVELIYYGLTVNVEGEGEVDISPDQDEYEDGEEVTLTAVPEDGWSFVEWTGDHEGTEEEITITMDSDMTITAHFEEDEEPIEYWWIIGMIAIAILIILIVVMVRRRKEPSVEEDEEETEEIEDELGIDGLEEEIEEEIEETEETEEDLEEELEENL